MNPQESKPIGDKALEILALGIDLLDGKKGDKGDKGDNGIDGKDGVDGANGKDGYDGKDGQNGKNGIDGKDGINGKDGRDGKDGKKGEKGDKGNDAPTVDVVVRATMPAIVEKIYTQVRQQVASKTYNATEIEGLAEFVTENGSGSVSFETVSKNLDATDATLNYTGENLTSIAYVNGITKTLNYTGENLTSVVLSGSTPSGINLTKTLSYTGDNLTGVLYS